MRKVLLYKVVALILLSSCNNISQTEIARISVIEAASNPKSLLLSEIATETEIIQLETSPDCLISAFPRFYFNEEYIISVAFRQVLLFDRNNGRFIREIGSYEKGPNGYRFTKFIMPYNKVTNSLMMGGWGKKSFEYNLNGRKIREIALPEFGNTLGIISHDEYASYIKNYSGTEKRLVVIFDSSNKISMTYPNYNTFEKTLSLGRFAAQGWFFHRNQTLNFFEVFNDTIYQITSNDCKPQMIFDFGKYSPPYELQSEHKFIKYDQDEYYMIYQIFGSDRLTFFTYRYKREMYCGYYDNNKAETFVADNNRDFGFNFYNDIDDFMYFDPGFICDNKSISFIDGYKITEYLSENETKPSNSKLSTILKTVREEDNPLIIIATLKK